MYTWFGKWGGTGKRRHNPTTNTATAAESHNLCCIPLRLNSHLSQSGLEPKDGVGYTEPDKPGGRYNSSVGSREERSDIASELTGRLTAITHHPVFFSSRGSEWRIV